ncbi:hypothetical protein Syun_008624 [Stephania yunnanensis]|uniref:Peroxidase n=1 Tax=Stephania yunnanensis TaxID=152371 RepID=A0AAP0KFM8_9MAGN
MCEESLKGAAPLIKLPQRPSNRSINRRSSAIRVDFYSKSCPQFEQLVSSITSQQFKDSPVSAPATIRLFFHDCFVEAIRIHSIQSIPSVAGCDGSILISASGAEREAEENKSLAKEGFEVVDKVKALVETKCPSIVSCADAGGPYYQVKKGRWDGKISKASRVGSNIPRANSTIDQLLNLFASKGLSLKDMVALSGAHTIGFSHCNQFLRRLYNYKGTNKADPSMDLRLLKALRMSCPPFGGSAGVIVPFDVAAPLLSTMHIMETWRRRWDCSRRIKGCSWMKGQGQWWWNWGRRRRSFLRRLGRPWKRWVGLE